MRQGRSVTCSSSGAAPSHAGALHRESIRAGNVSGSASGKERWDVSASVPGDHRHSQVDSLRFHGSFFYEKVTRAGKHPGVNRCLERDSVSRLGRPGGEERESDMGGAGGQSLGKERAGCEASRAWLLSEHASGSRRARSSRRPGANSCLVRRQPRGGSEVAGGRNVRWRHLRRSWRAKRQRGRAARASPTSPMAVRTVQTARTPAGSLACTAADWNSAEREGEVCGVARMRAARTRAIFCITSS